MFKRLFIAFSLGASLFLGACVNNSTYPAEEIASMRVVTEAAPFVSLITMVNDKSGGGEHSALLINGSQQVLYDPAGSFRHSRVLRSDDMMYGMTPGLVDYYNSYHARFGYYVKIQKLEISRELADALIARAQAEGAVPKLTCSIATTNILSDFDMFASIGKTFLPGRQMRRFGALPGIEETIIREDDIGQNYN